MRTRSIDLSKWSWLEAIASKAYDNGDPSHDLAHVRRVVATCARLGDELGADFEVLIPAAWLHDVVNVPKNSPDRARASAMAVEKARAVLAGRTHANRLPLVLAAIEEHSYSRGAKPSSLESAILQDADRLDALGAIGILRTATVGARMGCSYYDLDDPFAERRPIDDRRFTLDHFEAKLLKLAAGMNTEPARKEAEARTRLMRAFLGELAIEIGRDARATVAVRAAFADAHARAKSPPAAAACPSAEGEGPGAGARLSEVRTSRTESAGTSSPAGL